MARLFPEGDMGFVPLQSMTLNADYASHLMRIHGDCHEAGGQYDVLAVYVISEFSEMLDSFNMGFLDHFECSVCGKRLDPRDSDAAWM
jgi:hypothetical protein